jgi:hypothetical protein
MHTTRQVRAELRRRANLSYSLQHTGYLINQGRFPDAVKGPAKNSHWQFLKALSNIFISTLKVSSPDPT